MLLSTLHVQKMGQKTFWVKTALLLNEMHAALLPPRHASEWDTVGKGRKNSLIVPAPMWTRSLWLSLEELLTKKQQLNCPGILLSIFLEFFFQLPRMLFLHTRTCTHHPVVVVLPSVSERGFPDKPREGAPVPAPVGAAFFSSPPLSQDRFFLVLLSWAPSVPTVAPFFSQYQPLSGLEGFCWTGNQVVWSTQCGARATEEGPHWRQFQGLPQAVISCSVA